MGPGTFPVLIDATHIRPRCCGVATRVTILCICGHVYRHSNAAELGSVVSDDSCMYQHPAVRSPIRTFLLQTCTSSFLLRRAWIQHCERACVCSATMALSMLDLLSNKLIATLRGAALQHINYWRDLERDLVFRTAVVGDNERAARVVVDDAL